jgi:hypothetical protein
MMSVIGAGTGLVLIYFIPLIVNIVYYRIKHPKGKLREILMGNGTDNEINNEIADDSSTPQTNFSEVLNGPHIISKKEPSEFKDKLFYLSQIILILIGFFTLIIQFVKINFFNIHLTE